MGLIAGAVGLLATESRHRGRNWDGCSSCCSLLPSISVLAGAVYPLFRAVPPCGPSAMVVIALWIFFALFMTLVVSIAANVLYPMGQTATASQILANYNCQMNLNRLSPYYLYSEAVSTIMNPQVRSTNIILPQQLSGAINGYLSLGQSLLLVWPHLTGLLALTAVVFAVSYQLYEKGNWGR